MLLWIKEILLRSAVGIVAGHARLGARPDPMVGIQEGFVLLVAFGAEVTALFLGQGGIIGAVGIVAGGTVLGGGRMQCPIAPVLGHLAVTLQTEGRQAPFQVPGVGRAVAVMAGHALHLGGRVVLHFGLFDLGLHLRMTVETDLTRLILDEVLLIGGMGTVTGEAVPLGKGRMGRFFRLFGRQILMAGQAELPLVGGRLE